MYHFIERSYIVGLCCISGIDRPDSPEKFPNYTFGVVHNKARSYFIHAENDEEKLEWVQMFQLCCACVKGIVCVFFISRLNMSRLTLYPLLSFRI